MRQICFRQMECRMHKFRPQKGIKITRVWSDLISDRSWRSKDPHRIKTSWYAMWFLLDIPKEGAHHCELKVFGPCCQRSSSLALELCIILRRAKISYLHLIHGCNIFCGQLSGPLVRSGDLWMKASKPASCLEQFPNVAPLDFLG